MKRICSRRSSLSPKPSSLLCMPRRALADVFAFSRWVGGGVFFSLVLTTLGGSSREDLTIRVTVAPLSLAPLAVCLAEPRPVDLPRPSINSQICDDSSPSAALFPHLSLGQISRVGGLGMGQTMLRKPQGTRSPGRGHSP